MMIHKQLRFISILFLFIIMSFTVLKCSTTYPGISNLICVILGLIVKPLWNSFQDLSDVASWELSQRKLERGKIINDDTIIRISFAYLYRIKVERKYLLIKNERGTNKYQPIGGVYKLQDEEKIILKNRYHVMDDDKVPIDKSSHNDYRIRVRNQYLRNFVGRFDGDAKREKIDNVGREFKEELIDTKILNWKTIKYRVCGRHMTEVQYSQHFQIFELLLADIVELMPNDEQMEDLCCLMKNDSDLYRFVTAEEIKSLGIQANSANFLESISDHTFKILEEEESDLMWIPNAKKEYTISL